VQGGPRTDGVVMSEAPKGLLSVLGEICEEMQATGCSYEQAMDGETRTGARR
jgi:hypothetical protein